MKQANNNTNKLNTVSTWEKAVSLTFMILLAATVALVIYLHNGQEIISSYATT